MKIKKILSMALVLLMIVSLLPAADAEWTVPENYGEDEYNQLAAFLETEDADEVKNGTKLNEDYDVNDPDTWGDGWVFFPYGDAPYHVMNIGWGDTDLVGSLDVSNFPELSGLYLSNTQITSVNAANCPELGDVECAYGAFQSLNFSGCESLSNLICDDSQLTELNVRGCTGLTGSIFCDNNQLTELDVSDCIELKSLACNDNLLENLNVSNCAALTTLNAQNNALSTIDLSDCVNLQVLNLSGNKLKSIDMTACTNLHLDSVTAKGPGSVGYWETMANGAPRIILYAAADKGKSFLGWYSADGELLSTDAEWDISSTYESVGTDVTAKFAGTMDYGYYLIGRSGWTLADIGPEDKFSTNYDASTEEYKLITTLEEGQQLKVVLVSNGNELGPWFPDPGDNYTVDAAHAGEKIVYFRPTYTSDWEEFGGHIYITDPPSYHVYFNQPAHGTLTADKTVAREGETITVEAIPDTGYYPAQPMSASPIPSNTSWPDDYHYSFSMPASDVTVSIGWNQMCVDQGFYYSVDTNAMDLTPSQKFSEVSSAYGEYEFEAVLEEGKSLSLTRVLTEQGWSNDGLRWDWSSEVPWTEGDDHWLITAEKAGHAKIFLTDTKAEGYTKAFDYMSYIAGSSNMWLIVKYYQPITVLPAEHGTVTAPADAFEDETVMLTVTPDEGYMLDTLTVTDENGNTIELHGVNGTNFYMPASPVTVSATFKSTSVFYTVTLVGAGEGVTITTTKETAQEGDNVDINIRTDSNHSFVSITVTDEQGNVIETTKRPDGANKYRFVMPASNVTVTVVTLANYKYPLWVGSTQVADVNRENILGDGTASYDPETRTLSFTTAAPAIVGNYGGALINYTGDDSVTIEAPNGLYLAGSTATGVSQALYSYGADVVINGDVTLDLPDANGLWTTTKTLTVNGNVTGTVKAIALYGFGGITVNGDVNITNQNDIRVAYSTGAVSISGDFTAVGCGIDAAGGISIGGNVTITNSGTSAFGLLSTNGAITVGSGVWDITASSNPLKAAGGIVIPEDHSIVLPEGGVLGTLSDGGKDYTVVYEADGTTLATHVIISGQTAPTGYHINVTDYTKGLATTSLDAEALYSGEVTFTVSCDQVCKVGILNADGTITKLACTMTDGTHSFTVTVTDADVDLVIVIKGDFDLNGSMKKLDATSIKKYLVDLYELGETTAAVQKFAGDVNDDGQLKQLDATTISKVLVDLATIDW